LCIIIDEKFGSKGFNANASSHDHLGIPGRENQGGSTVSRSTAPVLCLASVRGGHRRGKSGSNRVEASVAVWESWVTARGGASAPAGPSWSGSSPASSPQRPPPSLLYPSLAGAEAKEGAGSSSTAPSCSPRMAPSPRPLRRAPPRSGSATAAC
jgi:hypothetical protein